MKKLFVILSITISVLLTNSGSAMYNVQTSPETLVLNNGARWKVDNTTNNNVKEIKTILAGFDKGENRSLNAYHNTANELRSGLNKMIRECKMKGPDHLALHKWLEPLMEQVAKLKQASNTAEAARSFSAIRLQSNRYDQYFEI